jgi:vitamin B12 transporter
MRSPLAALLCLFLAVAAARGEEDDLRSLELYNGGKAGIVSANRSPRPASQTAENITVVTAKEIEALNAHTLADVLFTVTGVQLEMLRTPGSVSNINLQGSNFNHILVLIDNVPINNLSDNFPDISSVPVQMIERIEIVKGAASSSWGSALGGVINVITKSPQTERPVAGVLSASLGKRGTADGRAELSGTLDRFGYYLTGGKLRSDGLLTNNMVDLNNFYGKLHYELPVHGSLTLTTALTDGKSGQIAYPTSIGTLKGNQDISQLITTLSAQYPLSDSFSVDAALRTRRMTSEVVKSRMDDDLVLQDVTGEETSGGASVKLSWHDDLQRIVAGLDYDHVKAHLSQPLLRADLLNRRADRAGVYLNDTFTLGDFAITPSARYDRTDTNGDLFSPGFGITYAISENSLLRGYTARGYSLTSLIQTDSAEKVWTSQIGFESADVPYLWLKGTLFRNDTWDINVESGSSAPPGKQRQLKQGFELEARTLPFLATSLSLGYTFVDARDGDSDAVLKGVARHTLNLGVKYEDSRYLRALLTGHYIDWNADGTQQDGKYHAILWDLYLGKKLDYRENGSLELFLSVRNLFNTDQYLFPYLNPGRWAEAGVRCAF